MLLILFCSYISYCSSQVHNYYIYPSNSSSALYTFSYQQVNGEYNEPPSKLFTREISPTIQAQRNQGSSILSDPVLRTNNQTTPSSMRTDSAAQYATVFGNSASFAPSTTVLLACAMPDAVRFACNVGNVCCPCSVGAAQGSCSAGACASPSLRCEAASGMCCPRPPLTNSSNVNDTARVAPLLAMDTARNESGSTQLLNAQGPIYSSNATQSSANSGLMTSQQWTTAPTMSPING
ncbi:hypothetical protein PRIPAC_95636 [Pristionchus pacificus]|uniref:Uncharacterized protein n=1 Tax=Pristionchus pacificus TaxID=54126 RepID=A0A2A6D157_PRIPA|nr:hypothetical protein PRIPAC_95636 [Pristionchus pacificus]|eukprot:PDM84222.1 hypothetical protein PRIPAC_33245 [Pristionchus pacificus]